MDKSNNIKEELKKQIVIEKIDIMSRFFKTGKGEYGEGDIFIGVPVPVQRKIAKKFISVMGLLEIENLLKSEIHEYRQTALFMLVYKFEKTNDEGLKEKIVELYLNNADFINNWDLVDSSAYKILGPFLEFKNKGILYEFAHSNHLWKQRIAIISTFYYIKKYKFEDTIKISEILINHKHDLIHKAVGWMLREIGNLDYETEYDFLLKYYKIMPRTMLRYSIEKFEEETRRNFLKGRI